VRQGTTSASQVLPGLPATVSAQAQEGRLTTPISPEAEAILLADLRRHGRLGRACEAADVGLRRVQRLRKRDAALARRIADAYRAWLSERSKGRSHRYPYPPRTGRPLL
jgi:hypothetical protein